MIFRRYVFSVAVTVLMLLSAAVAAPKKPLKPGDPVISIPLDDIGFEMAQPRLLLGGATMYSLNFVDNTHLLVTFNSHGLIPRDRDMTPQDGDRMVSAELVELPSGKVLARTKWHTRDREQYLWPLSHGLFLLRIKNRLTVIDPLGNVGSGDAFREEAFLDVKRRVAYVTVSPGGDLLLIETVAPPKRESNETAIAQAAGTAPEGAGLVLDTLSDPLTELLFFRLLFSEEAGKPTRLLAQSAGKLTTHALVRIPATAEGFLDMTKESAQTWLFDFQEHSGKRVELSPFDTTCAPSPYFISRSEFVAFGCTQRPGEVELSEFDMHGEEPWIQVLSGKQFAPVIVSAPDAGRFAFSHIQLAGSYYDELNLGPEDVSGQEITVFQNHDGRTLLKVHVSPAQRMGQNFDLSPDGLSFTTIRNGFLEVYKLPALSAKDRQQVELAQKEIPEKNEARIRLMPQRPGQAAPQSATIVTPVAMTPVAAPMALKESSIEPGAGIAGSLPATVPAQVDEPRTPPSLYGPDYPKPKKGSE